MTKQPCDWSGHRDALDEAGWCPVCDEGELDAGFAARNGVDTSLDDDPNDVLHPVDVDPASWPVQP